MQIDSLCGCGGKVRYQTPSGWACNKFFRCTSREELMEKVLSLTIENTHLKESLQAIEDGLEADKAMTKALQQVDDNTIAELREELADVREFSQLQKEVIETYKEIIMYLGQLNEIN